MAGVVTSINSIMINLSFFVTNSFSDLSRAVNTGGGGTGQNFSCFLYWLNKLGLDLFLTNVFSTLVALGVFWASSILFFISMKTYLRISTYAGKALLG